MSHPIAAIARHGQYEQPEGVPSAHLPHGLTDAGRAAARQMADDLLDLAAARGWRIDSTIECSSLLRAWQTATVAAERIAERLSLTPEVRMHDDLCERGLGAAANLTVAEIEAIVAADPRYQALPAGWKASPSVRLPFIGAESLQQAGARVAQHLESRMAALSPARPGDDPSGDEPQPLRLFVSHGAALRHAAVALGVLDAAEVPGLSMFHCRPVYLARRGVGRFERVAGEFKVRPAAQARD